MYTRWGIIGEKYVNKTGVDWKDSTRTNTTTHLFLLFLREVIS